MQQMVHAVFGAPSGVTPSRSAAAVWPEDRPIDARRASAGKMPQ